jgi:hypothetical protein
MQKKPLLLAALSAKDRDRWLDAINKDKRGAVPKSGPHASPSSSTAVAAATGGPSSSSPSSSSSSAAVTTTG